jgi:hypothetical protein
MPDSFGTSLVRRGWPDHMGYPNAIWHAPLVAGIVATYPEAVYVEVGVLTGECWRVAAPYATEAHGVDVIDSWPDMAGIGRLWRMESQEFFRVYDGPAPDVVFVDGGHHLPTCRDDVTEALRMLAPGGTVIIHDTLPRPITLWELSGDGWQTREMLEADASLATFTFWRYPGLTIVRKRA